MCLAVPARIISINEEKLTAVAEVSGARTECSLMLTPEARAEDYILIHAGYAINVIDEEEARKTIEIFQEIEKLNLHVSTEED